MKSTFCLCKILQSIFLMYASLCQAHVYDLSVCAIFKNEAPYLKEWIEYHRIVGVQHFYLYNHESTDDYLEILQPYIEKGIVELEDAINLPDFNSTQSETYNRGLSKSRNVSVWVAFIDIDEFITPTEDVNLTSLLNNYPVAGIALNWSFFGTSNVAKLVSDKLMIAQLYLRAPDNFAPNSMIKSIVRPELVDKFLQPHNPLYLPGWHAVDVCMIPQQGALNQYIKLDPIRINHYWTRDEYYYNLYKIPRRVKWGATMEQMKGSLNVLNSIEDHTMFRYIPRLKQAMNMF